MNKSNQCNIYMLLLIKLFSINIAFGAISDNEALQVLIHNLIKKNKLCLIGNSSNASASAYIDTQNTIGAPSVCRSNLFFRCAKNQPNLCSRFFKLIHEQNCILLYQNKPPSALSNLIFGKKCQSICYSNIPTPSPTSIIEICKNYIEPNTFTVIIIDEKISPEIQRALFETYNAYIIGIDSLLTFLENTHSNSENTFKASRFLQLLQRKIIILSSAAIIPQRYELRKKQYIESIESLNRMGYNPIIIESCVTGPTFLDDYCQVIYTQTNNPHLQNKGVNEALSIKAALKQVSIDDTTMIVKLTGRYKLTDDLFLRIIENNPNIEVCAKRLAVVGDFTGCFAMQANYFKDMFETFDLPEMEDTLMLIEWATGQYTSELHERHVTVKYLDNLNLEANIFYSGHSDAISYW